MYWNVISTGELTILYLYKKKTRSTEENVTFEYIKKKFLSTL